MENFRFADFDKFSGTVPAYIVNKITDQISIGRVLVIDGIPCDRAGTPLKDDDETRTITGWKHKLCASFNEGGVLLPLRKSLQPE